MKTPDFSRFLTQYLTHYLPVQRNLSSNTICSYRDTFKLLLIFCRDEKGFNIAKLNLAKLDKKCIKLRKIDAEYFLIQRSSLLAAVRNSLGPHRERSSQTWNLLSWLSPARM